MQTGIKNQSPNYTVESFSIQSWVPSVSGQERKGCWPLLPPPPIIQHVLHSEGATSNLDSRGTKFFGRKTQYKNRKLLLQSFYVGGTKGPAHQKHHYCYFYPVPGEAKRGSPGSFQMRFLVEYVGRCYLYSPPPFCLFSSFLS